MDFPKYEENEILKAVPVSISAQANVVKNRTMRGQALWYVAPGRGELREAVVAPAGSGKVRVRALFGAISRGTERLVLAGRVPESEFDRMRPPFMGGSFPFPVKYGYAIAGRVEAGPDKLIGRNVFVPLALPPMAIHTLFRLEWNVRAAAIVGLIGAGGIGQALFNAMQLFFYKQMAAYIVITGALVWLMDAAGQLARRSALRHNHPRMSSDAL